MQEDYAKFFILTLNVDLGKKNWHLNAFCWGSAFDQTLITIQYKYLIFNI